MAEPYLGQVIPVAFDFAPPGWLLCDGSLVQIAAFEALYTLIGTTYGGDGTTTFGLPKLCGAVAVGAGAAASETTYVLGQGGGTATVTLNANQVPIHSHPIWATDTIGTTNIPASTLVPSGSNTPGVPYSTDAPTIAMSSQALQPSAAGGQAHENRQPLLCINYIIATSGLYPAQG